MELQETLMKRKSVRRYKKQSVDLAKIESMIEAANLAPTWKNSQVVRYYVVSSEQMLSKLKQCLAEFNQENAKDAPVLIVSSIVLNRSGFERDGTPSNEIKNGWGCYDCGMHDMVLLLKAAELGLSTLVMGIRDSEKIKQLLDIESCEAILSVIAVGYGDIDPQRPSRKTVQDMTKFI